MQIMAIDSIASEDYYGPYTDPALAAIVLDIVKKVIDDEAELLTFETDVYAKQLKAGLLPFRSVWSSKRNM
jgi:hypothetical protein